MGMIEDAVFVRRRQTCLKADCQRGGTWAENVICGENLGPAGLYPAGQNGFWGRQLSGVKPTLSKTAPASAVVR